MYLVMVFLFNILWLRISHGIREGEKTKDRKKEKVKETLLGLIASHFLISNLLSQVIALIHS